MPVIAVGQEMAVVEMMAAIAGQCVVMQDVIAIGHVGPVMEVFVGVCVAVETVPLHLQILQAHLHNQRLPEMHIVRQVLT